MKCLDTYSKRDNREGNPVKAKDPTVFVKNGYSDNAVNC